MVAKLLVLAGPPCSGKSTLAGSIQTSFGINLLQADRILSNLIPDSQRSKSDRAVAYRAMHMLAEELLRCARSVVLDATYGLSVHRKAVETLVTNLAAPLYLIECHVSPDTAVTRFRNRPDYPASDLTEARVRDLAQRYCYSGQGLALTAEMPRVVMLERVEDYLRQTEPLSADGRWSASAFGYSA
jgi:predicted kinase